MRNACAVDLNRTAFFQTNFRQVSGDAATRLVVKGRGLEGIACGIFDCCLFLF